MWSCNIRTRAFHVRWQARVFGRLLLGRRSDIGSGDGRWDGAPMIGAASDQKSGNPTREICHLAAWCIHLLRLWLFLLVFRCLSVRPCVWRVRGGHGSLMALLLVTHASCGKAGSVSPRGSSMRREDRRMCMIARVASDFGVYTGFAARRPRLWDYPRNEAGRSQRGRAETAGPSAGQRDSMLMLATVCCSTPSCRSRQLSALAK